MASKMAMFSCETFHNHNGIKTFPIDDIVIVGGKCLYSIVFFLLFVAVMKRNIFESNYVNRIWFGLVWPKFVAILRLKHDSKVVNFIDSSTHCGQVSEGNEPRLMAHESCVERIVIVCHTYNIWVMFLHPHLIATFDSWRHIFKKRFLFKRRKINLLLWRLLFFFRFVELHALAFAIWRTKSNKTFDKRNEWTICCRTSFGFPLISCLSNKEQD